MTFRNSLPLASGGHSAVGNAVGCPCATDRHRHPVVPRQSRCSDSAPASRRHAAPSWLRRAAFEVGDTLSVVTLIVRFVVFVAVLLAQHHVRRLWLRMLGREVSSNARQPSTLIGAAVLRGTVPPPDRLGH